MKIIKYKALFIGFAVLLVLASFGLMHVYGVKKGIDFTGGTVAEIAYTKDVPTLDKKAFEAAGIALYQTGTSSYRVITNRQFEEVVAPMSALISQNNTFPFQTTALSTVGPTLGKEMTQKAGIAIAIVILIILIFIAFAFKEVSYPVSSWKYGVAAMVTLVHDIVVPTGVYVLLSHFYGAEINTLFVIALLTIMAVTISDKIVVFDRIRENLKLHKNMAFDQVVGMSLVQTMARSINTSLSTVLALVALYFFGPESTKFFSLTLIVGIIVGTYSSIFVASPLLVVWNNFKKK
jgi:preprotein translocase subunit SecF